MKEIIGNGDKHKRLNAIKYDTIYCHEWKENS